MDSTSYYVANTRLFDGNAIQEHAGVLVVNDRITWIGPHARAPREAQEARELPGESRTLTPGLIDAHVHLCFDGGHDFLQEAKEPVAYAAVKCIRNGCRQLAAGVTTVRDLGGIGVTVPCVARAIADGLCVGPQVLAAGEALTISGGHGWNSFARQVDGPYPLRQAVREQLRAGANVIKLIATGGVLTPGIPVDFRAFTTEEIEAAVDEAHKWNAPISAHAIGKEGIAACVHAGIDSIEHGFQITTEIAQRMSERGTAYVPTLSALAGIMEHPASVPDYVFRKGSQVFDQAHEAFANALKAGVPFVCGTDAGTHQNPHGSALGEIRRMIQWGLPPVMSWQAATRNAAALLRADDIGTVAEGYLADLALWDGNPIEDPVTAWKPALVLRRGRPFVEESASDLDEGH
jgi:imidazolonepropionase-like amidohydrolase